MRRAARIVGWAALLGLQYVVARSYLALGTEWHWLLHQLIGWGLGLAVAALLGVVSRYRVPALVALLGGQLVSIWPDLEFRLMRMPHEPYMDVYLGHISIHTGPSPVLVALGSVLLGGWAWIAMAYGRKRAAAGLGLAAVVLVAGACLLARPLPDTLAEYPADTPPLALPHSR